MGGVGRCPAPFAYQFQCGTLGSAMRRRTKGFGSSCEARDERWTGATRSRSLVRRYRAGQAKPQRKFVLQLLNLRLELALDFGARPLAARHDGERAINDRLALRPAAHLQP